MIAFLTLCYVAVLGLLVKLKILPNKPATWMSILVWVLILFIGLFVPMQWGAPSGPARVMTYTVQIIPNVSGQVTEVPVTPNVPLKKGDVLFKIDPTTYQASVDATEARLNFQEMRLEQYKELESSSTGTQFQVEETQAEVDRLTAELTTARWNLRETIVVAPAEGFVTYLALRPGQRVTNFPFQPAMTFVDTSRDLVGVQINQIHLRFLKVGQTAEIAFKTRPGRIYTGKVVAVFDVTSQAQAVIGGTIPLAQQVQAEPYFVGIELDDDLTSGEVSAGAVGTAAIYTESVAVTHVIRKVMIRMESIVNYLNPWL